MLLPAVALVLAVAAAVPCEQCVATHMGSPVFMGGPTGDLFDSPFASATVGDVVVGFSANQETYVVTNGTTVAAALPTPLGTGLGANRSNPDALDHCGAWLNAVVFDAGAGVLRGFYHEEWKCDYARHDYTNKSVAYAESRDGGRSWAKLGYPANQVILPPAGNTTTAHQTGEGDHGVVRVTRAGDGDHYLLFFREWDPPDGYGTTIGVARASAASGGTPGSFAKWFHGTWTEPGVGGRSDMVRGIPGTAVYHRRDVDDLVAVGEAGPWGWGHGVGLGFAPNATHGWWAMQSPLVHLDSMSWDRAAPVGELWAYPALAGPGGATTVNATYADVFYTYLEPNATFADRYLTRRPLHMSTWPTPPPPYVPQAVIDVDTYTHATSGDFWATTALVPPRRSYTRAGAVVSLMTAPLPACDSHPVYDCFIDAWGDHMVGLQGECATPLRTLGWLCRNTTSATVAFGLTPTPLYRCFNSTARNHAVSTDAACTGLGEPEFLLGYGFQPL